MVRSDIVERIQSKINCSKRDAADLLESVFKIMKDTLETGEDVKISGFGGFLVKKKADRKGRNPATGEDMTIVARRVLSFKTSQLLRKAING